MPLNSQYIDDKFDKVDKKQDQMLAKLTALELDMTKKVSRNSFILNGMLWFIGIVIAANVVAWVSYIW